MTEGGKTSVEVAVVGGGIVGLASARELLARRAGLELVVLEREQDVGLGQTTWNSGVIHAGVYYAPGSLRARLCVEGARELYAYCDERGIPAVRCGKLIVATDEAELPGLDELERRGHANGVPGLRRVGADEIRAIEPHARGIAALHSPATGIVDFAEVARALRADIEAAGGRVLTGCEIVGIERESANSVLLRTHPHKLLRAEAGDLLCANPPAVHRANPRALLRADRRALLRADRGALLRAERVLFCAGGSADRLAVMDGGDPDPRIVPFRGSYLRLRREGLVRALVYPVPDPRLPFLGVHLTRHPGGGVLVGPTALLVPRMRSLAWPGSWRVMRRFWRTGVTEIRHAVSTTALVAEARRFVPELTTDDVEPAFSGIRAQAVARDGTLLDDFAFSGDGTTLHVRNAPSPAATSSLAIARYIADRFEAR